MLVRYKHRSNNIYAPLKNKAMEIDVKINNDRITLGHDVIDHVCYIEDFLDNCSTDTELAINIKQSGMVNDLKKIMEKYNVKSYFFFDMAFPDLIEYINLIPEHTAFRISQYENYIDVYDSCAYTWLDYFSDFNKYDFEHTNLKNKIIVASPELHGELYFYQNIIKNAYGIVTKF